MHRQILFKVAIAAIAGAILVRMSAEQVPSLHRVAPRYLKLVTSSSFWPFMLIFALMLFVLLVMILFFSVLTSIPHAAALFTSLLVKSCGSTSLLPIRSMTSANRRLHMGLQPMEMDVWWSWSLSCMMFSTNRLNRMSENEHP